MTAALKIRNRPGAEGRGNKKAPGPPRQSAGASSFKLSSSSVSQIRKHWRPLGGIMAVYVILNLVLVGNLGYINSTADGVKAAVETATGGGKATEALGGFADIITSGSSGTSQAGSLLQNFLFVIVSLAIIWSLRQLHAGKSLNIKAAYYQSMSPLIPYLLVGVVIILQLLPLVISATLLGFVLAGSSGIMVNLAFGLLLVLGASWTFYMLSCSIVAVYIVTLPDMQPRRALRSAKKLVSSRRLAVFRKMAFLPLLALAAMAVVLIPLIFIWPPLATGAFYLLSAASLLFAHTYLYNLYKSLI